MEPEDFSSEERLKKFAAELEAVGFPFGEGVDPLVFLRRNFYIMQKIRTAKLEKAGLLMKHFDNIENSSPLENLRNLSKVSVEVIISVLDEKPFGLQLDFSATVLNCLILLLNATPERPFYFDILLTDVFWELDRRGYKKEEVSQ